MMIKRWTDRHIDLENLADLIRSYVESKSLSIDKEAYEDGSKILIVTIYSSRRHTHKIRIYIKGHSKDFTIILDANSMDRGLKSPRIIGRFLSLFGGGLILLESLKAQEAFHSFQKEFWKFISEKIANLSNLET